MPRIPLFRLGQSVEEVAPPTLASYSPSLTLTGLQLGVDNLRHDVHLSEKFVTEMRAQIALMIARYGNVEGMLAAEDVKKPTGNQFIGADKSAKAGIKSKAESAGLKPLLAELHVAALNRAKSDGNMTIDLLARLAITKFLRVELNAQFVQTLERCRGLLNSYEGVRAQRAIEYRERVSEFQVAKKTILRKAGQELFRTLRDVEKETLARMRRSLFGNDCEEQYRLFLNPLAFADDGRDAQVNAENYVMLGNFDRDPDRYLNIRRMVCDFLQTLGLGGEAHVGATLDAWLNVPENAQELVGGGTPDEETSGGKAQRVRLNAWVAALEREGAMDHVIASYEVVPLLPIYSPRINAHQLKNGLISREERDRLEKLMQEQGKTSAEPFREAVSRVANCRGTERTKLAGRFLRDFLRYHRDWRRLEVLNAALETVNLIGTGRLRELSAMNSTLYEFLLAQEQKPAESKVARHVIIKADVRDSTRLTRSLMARDMNPASYFSLNFYDPVNKLLPKYGAEKVFLEGDAIILALFENEGDAPMAVSKACVLAREIIEIVCGYNKLLQGSGLPPLELGIGISYQDSAPLYLMDGDARIMISDALNESDRLSSCNKRVRKTVEGLQSPFNVYAFQTVGDAEAGESADDFIMKYNLNGVRMSEPAFRRLQEEIALEQCKFDLPRLWGKEEFQLWRGMVPLGNDIFRKVIVRSSKIAQIDAASFGLNRWTERCYYEVCTNAAIYSMSDAKAATAR
jgi:class 3 adenylate cyclase